MTTTPTKWMPQQWRSGCWANAHTRANGAKVRRQLVQLTESFNPTTPWPDREVSATSHDGRLTVTAHPRKSG